MKTWIDLLRRQRIKIGEAKYGKWHPDNFKDRDPIQEGIDELIDYLNYSNMAWRCRCISRRQYEKRRQAISVLLHEDKALLH